MVDQSITLAEGGDDWRLRAAKALYAREPFCLASRRPPSPEGRSMEVTQTFDWDAAPAFYQQACFDLVDVVIAALRPLQSPVSKGGQ